MTKPPKPKIPKTILIDKPIGETPYQTIQKLKQQRPELKDIKMAYAGRLDPLAHGLLIILIGDECKNRDHYQNLDKTYQFEILLGFRTDSYDILGLPEKDLGVAIRIGNKEIVKALKDMEGEKEQEFPPYSAKTVSGKPLFKWAREGRLKEIQIPTKKITIYEIRNITIWTINSDIIRTMIHDRIKLVTGDFRQKEILNKWDKTLENDSKKEFKVISAEAKVSSGTYIRSIANNLGQQLGCGGLALDIHRTEVGEYSIH